MRHTSIYSDLPGLHLDLDPEVLAEAVASAITAPRARLQVSIINHPTSPAHRVATAESRGRIYAVTYAEPFPSVEAVQQLWRTERRAFRPYDETTGRYLR
jgi:hypothetical protein